MRREFVETAMFIEAWKDMGLTDEDIMELEDQLLQNPQLGEVVQGTGGLRKMRIALKGRGKRSGGRVAYVDFIISEKIVLITAYPKNEKTDLTESEKQQIKSFIEKLEKEFNKKR